MISQNYADWYWVNGGDEGHVFSSARMALVAVSDAGYLAWVAAGHKPTRIFSQAELNDVLVQQLPALSASAYQIKAALTQLGWRDAVEAAVAAADQNTKDAWLFQQQYRFDNARILAVAAVIGKTEADILQLFSVASGLRA